jgi:peroxiredoxin Q/BCP
MLKDGDLAPDFTLTADTGEDITLSDFRGKKVVVYFYPKDNTAGCTTEACSFRDDYAQFTALGAVVIGISPDSLASHAKFRLTYGLPFYLVSDPDHAVADAYGAWVEKVRCGKVSQGINRSTFVVGEDGALIKVFSKVKPEGHAQEVLTYLQ